MRETYRVESKTSGKGHEIEGTFDEACREAVSQCTTDCSVWVVWLHNVRLAECTMRGVQWRKMGY